MAGLTPQTLPDWLKKAFAVPNWLYGHGLGGLLGHRFVQLTHVGRRSGRTHHTVVEVIHYDPVTGETIVVSGFGAQSDWLRNIKAAGGAELDFGRGPRPAAYRILPLEEAIATFAGYERRNRLIRPVLHSTLSHLLGWTYDGSAEARRQLAAQLPLIAFRREQSGRSAAARGTPPLMRHWRG